MFSKFIQSLEETLLPQLTFLAASLRSLSIQEHNTNDRAIDSGALEVLM